MRTSEPGRVAVENVNHPGSTRHVDAARYGAMRQAILSALPAAGPGLTIHELSAIVRPQLAAVLFPGGLAGWWLKTVQLDLEAKRLIARTTTTPLRLRRI